MGGLEIINLLKLDNDCRTGLVWLTGNLIATDGIQMYDEKTQ
jgi:hypothetical protein